MKALLLIKEVEYFGFGANRSRRDTAGRNSRDTRWWYGEDDEDNGNENDKDNSIDGILGDEKSSKQILCLWNKKELWN